MSPQERRGGENKLILKSESLEPRPAILSMLPVYPNLNFIFDAQIIVELINKTCSYFIQTQKHQRGTRYILGATMWIVNLGLWPLCSRFDPQVSGFLFFFFTIVEVLRGQVLWDVLGSLGLCLAGDCGTLSP